MAHSWVVKQKYLKILTVGLLMLTFVSCGTEKNPKNKTVQGDIKSVKYIKVEFGELKRILEADSSDADNIIRSLGFDSDSSSFVFAHKSFFNSIHYGSTSKLGIGFYFLKNHPVLIYSQQFLIYTFPISQLYYYKSSILKDNWIYGRKQDINYNPTFEVTYPQEFYKIQGLYGEFNADISYYKDYASITMHYYKN